MTSGGFGSDWPFEQDKLFENALATSDENDPDRWEKIAKAVGSGKTVEDIKKHYDLLVEDLRKIECDLVPLPNYEAMEEKSKGKQIVQDDKTESVQPESSNAAEKRK